MLVSVSLSVFTFLLALCCATAASAADPVPHKDPFRGDSAFSDQPRPPPLVGAENRDVRRVRPRSAPRDGLSYRFYTMRAGLAPRGATVAARRGALPTPPPGSGRPAPG